MRWQNSSADFVNCRPGTALHWISADLHSKSLGDDAGDVVGHTTSSDVDNALEANLRGVNWVAGGFGSPLQQNSHTFS